MNCKPNIAIDGPAGAGKSTVAKLVAKSLGYLYIDTGAMYRAVTLKALRDGADLNDHQKLGRLASNVLISLKAGSDGNLTVLMDGEDVTEEIRLPAVSNSVSLVAKVPAVRRKMIELQKEMAAGGGVVMEGRDIGQVVLPDARVKIYLTAATGERARRRWKELADKGINVDRRQIEEDICNRDFIDTSREMDPLAPAPDAVIIDSTSCTVEGVVDLIVARITGERKER
ncbi:Cytidylate kinase [Pelotomaculum schinkii]|uniref:Cytidylate kinase n=1 Tax=Pelotomaculum schinkii TaxID=78350 RepID=A0A4Y7R929_9FIRM|nr:(d)CMP kinase [Pelotomaculum schinkii]TEB05307.1 Cytidylate kinase [Pelotomaculum schinkii]